MAKGSNAETVRVGIVGVGNMGAVHLRAFDNIAGAEVTAVCDVDPEKRAKVDAERGGDGVKTFEHYQAMVDSGLVDAVVIATPHYQHAEITVAAFAKGLHVLTEKPEAVSVAEARRMNEAHAKHSDLVFAIMFQMRTSPLYRKLRELIADGELGEVSRITWIATDWFRSWTYYASGGWRATWAGEGGGVLINQCPHNLDILQWVVGGMMPKRVTAVGFVGKTHPIEVEDEISAILEYDNGAIGHFITTTGEAPGTNRLEIAGDRGRVVVEGGKLCFRRTRQSVRTLREKTPQMFPRVEAWDIEVPLDRAPDGHPVVLENFIAAIRTGAPLIAPGEEGVKGLEIGNAMQMAGLTRQPVELPLDGERYEQFLKEMIARYGGKKNLQARSDAKADMAASFH